MCAREATERLANPWPYIKTKNSHQRIGVFRLPEMVSDRCKSHDFARNVYLKRLARRRSDGAPEPDGALKVVARKKIIHYHQLYLDHPEPIAFMPVAVDTSGRIYDDFLRLLFLHVHREASPLTSS